MTSEDEKKWQRIQEQLRIQLNGDMQPRVSSGRTLFGIPSEGEAKMAEFARQINEEQLAKLRQGARRTDGSE